MSSTFQPKCALLGAPRLLPVLVFALLAAWPVQAFAAEPAAPILVRDFAPGLLPTYLDPEYLTALGDKLYFAAKDLEHGVEPWVSDGTVAGTYRLADLCSGSCSSSPRGFEKLGNTVVFHGFAQDNSSVVYALAANEVSAIAESPEQIFSWARLGSNIYFLTQGNQMWRTDGSPQGSALIREFCPAATFCSAPLELKEVGGALYFAAVGELYRLAEGGDPEALFALGAGGTASEF